MRTKSALAITLLALTFGFIGFYIFNRSTSLEKKSATALRLQQEEDEQEEGGIKRRLYEWKMLHDPATGEIPRDAQRKDLALLATIKARQSKPGFRQTINNTYTAAGPSQNGGRTRTVAYDMRNNGVMLAAGVTGGIYRSTDGGSSWTYVSPVSDVRIVTCMAQDPRPGFQDTWYAGTGELLGASAAYPNAFVPGYGIYKSTDNGLTWTKLSSTIISSAREGFDSIFDMVFNIQVDGSGTVYAAILNYIIRSSNGGTSWGLVLNETGELENPDQQIENMITDIVISKPGVVPVRYYACFSGRNRDRDTAGVWTSTTGAFGTWTRIGHSDQVAGWRAYSNTTDANGDYTGGWGKTVLAVSPSNSNILYVMYQNAFSASLSVPEADLFRADLTNFPTVTWSANRGPNLQATRNVPLSSGGGTQTKYMETQGGYNMLLAVHPTNPNIVIAGGVNLFRSTDGFSTTGTFIGGLTATNYSDPNEAVHVDFHSFAFHPSITNRVVVGSDGGLAVTNDITAGTVLWGGLGNQYQTLQYYHVAIDPAAGSLTFGGGAQDNSTTYRDSKGFLNGSGLQTPVDANDHYVLIGGDGGSVALTSGAGTNQYFFGSVQEGSVYRIFANGAASALSGDLKPTGAQSEFITYFHLDPDNTNVMYYAGLNSLYRTTNATTVSASGWTQMTGVASTLTGNIFSLATSRGTYNGSSSHLYIGTSNGRIYRLTDPRDAAPSAIPVNITPSALASSTSSLVREIAVNPRNPDTVLAVVSNYGVASAFWTGNATSASPTWQLVEGNIASASFRTCAIVATTTGVEYYVGTSIGLFSTTTINGASTNWTMEGPPVLQGAIVNDLALRTSDNTLLIGTHGNGMFYTTIGNVPTAVPDVIVNDKRFITSVFPTVITNDINFRTGTIAGIRNIHLRVMNMSGQILLQKTQGYQAGTVQLGNLSTGTYLLEIWSDDRKYKHLQQFVKAK
ncbi:putative secreted protein (Por secretion system target) [Lacibacter cauensis]|uniref:Putative secreted protein (Por secretion system target) n=1 Tax=Lacibacter cauensis TaxID=510947 RepID=A0A562SJ46_9BACT|nr:T9SS type A sorting domain-containing protein [Lacibacter cauensis]TWI81188.1 putative secreted protein (Por secretion system target) [Lacibacter cauensis]